MSALPTVANVWDGNEMLHPHAPPVPIDTNPGWLRVTCSCCNGIAWSCGYDAVECRDCGGSGAFAVHAASGRAALYPGGPFTGWRFDPEDCARYLEGSAG